jgi:multiple sugar transport system substrate-binding protein
MKPIFDRLESYWDFCATRCNRRIVRTGKRTYAIGQPMGVDSSDCSNRSDVHGRVQRQAGRHTGKPLVDDPKVKQGLVNALRDYTSIRTRGCTLLIDVGKDLTTMCRSTTRRF